jgi:hypothetical protein
MFLSHRLNVTGKSEGLSTLRYTRDYAKRTSLYVHIRATFEKSYYLKDKLYQSFLIFVKNYFNVSSSFFH